MSETKIVNVRKDKYDIYIGRGSIWGNPFRIGPDGSRMKVIEKYDDYLFRNNTLLKRLPELKGKILGCHCGDLPCHGDVLKKYADSYGEEEEDENG